MGRVRASCEKCEKTIVTAVISHYSHNSQLGFVAEISLSRRRKLRGLERRAMISIGFCNLGELGEEG